MFLLVSKFPLVSFERNCIYVDVFATRLCSGYVPVLKFLADVQGLSATADIVCLSDKNGVPKIVLHLFNGFEIF